MMKFQKLFLNKKNKDIVFETIKKKTNESFLAETNKKVEEIIGKVKMKGDRALLELTHSLDHNNMKLSEIKVTPEEFEEAVLSIEQDMFAIIKEAIDRIKNFHKNQIEKSWFTRHCFRSIGKAY